MIKTEKIIQRIESQIAVCKAIDSDWISLTVETGKRIIELLKEQNPVKPICVLKADNKSYSMYNCPVCDSDVYYEQNYCCECGHAFIWKEDADCDV